MNGLIGKEDRSPINLYQDVTRLGPLYHELRVHTLDERGGIWGLVESADGHIKLLGEGNRVVVKMALLMRGGG